MTRREVLGQAGVGLLGLSLADVLKARAEAAAPPPARSCIFIFLCGGLSHIDTFDMKPDAPAEIRGEFRAIPTPVDGIRVCEHLPRTAKLARHLAVIRSVTDAGQAQNGHGSGMYYNLTGCPPDAGFFAAGRRPLPTDAPFIGSALLYHRRPEGQLPAVITLPKKQGIEEVSPQPGQFGGFLGPAYDPLFLEGERAGMTSNGILLFTEDGFRVPEFRLPPGVDEGRFARRRGLLERVDDTRRHLDGLGDVLARDVFQQKALSLVTSAEVARAFDLSEEPPALRDRYGRNRNGQDLLMARRLVERGVAFATVYWTTPKGVNDFNGGWDTHSDNFKQLQGGLLPIFDTMFSALIEDLRDRGMLDDTLVVVTSEMGRTPKVGDPRPGGATGRDHWTGCQSVLFAGGGIRGGQVYGASDEQAAYPADDACGPEDIAATIYEALGVPLNIEAPDVQNRPLRLLERGTALRPLLG